MRLEWSMAAQMISDDVRIVARFVPGRIVELIAGADELAIGELKTETRDARRPIKSRRGSLWDRYRH